MVDPEVVRRRLRRLDETVQRLRDLAARGREELLDDPVAQAAAERLLQVAIQIMLDIGAHVLSERGVVDWEEYRQIPDRLGREGILPEALALSLARAAGQRNILVHLYLEVDPELVYRALVDDLDVFEAFASHVLPLLGEEDEPEGT